MIVSLVFGLVMLCSPRSMAIAQQLTVPPGTKNVLLNVGSNLQPVRPPPDDPTTIVVAFEPIVGCRITPSPRLFVVHAAVAANDTLSTMTVLNKDGLSSSMSTPVYKGDVPPNYYQNDGTMSIVPVLSLKTVIQSFIQSPVGPLNLWFLKTDMQGFDFTALVGGGDLLKHVQYIKTEVW